jgi:hypothetical protein
MFRARVAITGPAAEAGEIRLRFPRRRTKSRAASPMTGDPMEPSIVVELAVRYLLVMLFFPFSALDKVHNFGSKRPRKREGHRSRTLRSSASDAAVRAALIIQEL